MESLLTQFAPAEKANPQQISADFKLLTTNALVNHMTAGILFVVLILDKHREVVYSKQRLIDLLGSRLKEETLGKRSGRASRLYSRQ